jgi:hypothetical protein
MSLEGLIAALVLTTITLIIIGRPFFADSTEPDRGLSRQRVRAQAYYERVVRNIRDLDDDHSIGKIAAEEYQTEREIWVQRGSVVLKLLDDLDEMPLTSANADDAAIDAAIEQAVQKMARTPEAV